MSERLAAAAAIVRRDARLYFSYRFRVVSQVGAMLLTLALFSQIARLVTAEGFERAGSYFDFAAVGLALLPMLQAMLVVAPAALREELVAGTFERLALSAFGIVGALLSTLAFPILSGILNATTMLMFAIVLFDLHVAWETVGLAIPVALLGALAAVPFAAVLLAATVLVKQVSAAGGFVVAALSLVSGAYFPVAQLPGWARWAADAQPLTPTLELLRHVLSGAPLQHGTAEPIASLVLFVVIGLPLCALVLSRACALARRHGILFEY